jgi:hypothetical protein
VVTNAYSFEKEPLIENKNMKITALIAGFILLFVVAFWYVLRDTTKEVSAQEPYRQVLYKELYTTQPSVLAKNLPEFSKKKSFFITEDTTLFEGVEKIADLPVGTKLRFEGAYEIQHGTSGHRYSILTGKVRIQDIEYDFEYPWGEYTRITLRPEPEWQFPKAVWEE